MDSLAKNIVVPIRPELQVVECRVAELEDGYARLSNMLLEEYSGANLTKRHFKVLLAVLRLTYGWGKALDRISDSQISAIAKLPVKKCNEAKLELVRMNILIKNGTLLGPNKNISEWNIPQNGGGSPKMGEKNPPKQGMPYNAVKSPKSGDKTSPKMGVSYPPIWGDTKETIPKKERKKDIPPIVPHGSDDVKPKKADNRATQLPSGFVPTEGNRLLAEKLGVELQSEFEAFSDYHRSKGSTFKDWSMALNTWLRNAVKFGAKKPLLRPQSLPTRAVAEKFNAKDYGATQTPSWMED